MKPTPGRCLRATAIAAAGLALTWPAAAGGGGDPVVVVGKAVSVRGSAVAGVKVTVAARSGGEPIGQWTVTTDTKGAFRVEVPPTAGHSLSLSVEGPADGKLAPFALMPPRGLSALRGPPGPVTILLAPATARLTGQILGADDKPVAGGTVTLSAVGMNRWLTRTGKTDASGRFEIAHLAPGRYVVRSVDPPAGAPWIRLYTWKPHGVRQVNLGKGAGAAETFRLPRGSRLMRRVLDESGRPIAGAAVSAGLDAASEAGPPSVYQKPGQNYSAGATTGADGRYVLPALTKETYSVAIRPPEGRRLAPSVLRGVNAADGEDVPLQDVTLQAGGRLIGVVTGADGKPVAGAEASLHVPTAGRFGVTRTATTDAAGRFVFADLPTGRYDVTIRPASGSQWGERTFGRLAVVGGLSAQHKLSLAGGATLSGAVTDPAGKPVAGASVTLRHGYSTRGSAVTDAAGRFTLRGVTAPATKGPSPRRGPVWGLRVGPPATAPCLIDASVGVDAPDPARPGNVQVRLPAGASVEGTVKGPDGKPLAGWRVVATQKVGRGGVTWTSPAATDAAGRYTLTQLKPGNWSVVATPPAESDLLTASLAARRFPAGKTAGVDLKAGRAATIVGRVVVNGRPVVGAQVRLERDRSARQTWSPSMGQSRDIAYTDLAGRFRHRGVPPGRHKLHCTPLNPQLRGQPTEVEVSGPAEVKATIQLTLTGSVRGAVRDAAGKPPARGAIYLELVAAGGAAGARGPRAYPDAEGQYRFEAVMPGRYSLTVKLTKRGTDAGLTAPSPTSVAVTGGKQTKLDVKLSGK